MLGRLMRNQKEPYNAVLTETEILHKKDWLSNDDVGSSKWWILFDSRLICLECTWLFFVFLGGGVWGVGGGVKPYFKHV